ncbi:hydroxymethylpyrimidine/phosphomethylpyrimidine kinase [Fructobacillus papyrifericola]|uniref:Hydroxymethylpyrimidine/phosphomethylpyrimidine kinase n=1 Tax=Fructobacillus papyrifericola TaxID=2713172 RepID=A0ABS5QUE2_9LACO|nr:hydroxymethylpyrimidine/phosphomethylpyrimidine kinase [Fructobacillus papyrifericola]MBS9335954.1 hydroxymethylpyrimidine/phosphomethylpyrimidine kinase [Fructobacillus papyrifericola]
MVKKVLTIAGSDSLSGGGLQDDLATFATEGLAAFSVITGIALIKEGEVRVEALSSALLKEQLASVDQVDQFDAIKVGMLQSVEQVVIVSDYLKNYIGPVVVDPVLSFKEGELSLEPGMVDAYVNYLLPLATIMTPNVKEGMALLETTEKPRSKTTALTFAKALCQRGRCSLYLKVGNPVNDEEYLDLFFDENGHRSAFRHHAVTTTNGHGSGCTLSAALTAQLAKGENLHDAAMKAADFTQKAIENGYSLSAGLPEGNVLPNWPLLDK